MDPSQKAVPNANPTPNVTSSSTIRKTIGRLAERRISRILNIEVGGTARKVGNSYDCEDPSGLTPFSAPTAMRVRLPILAPS